MKKVRLAILLILMVFLLAGCGSNLFIRTTKNAEGVIKVGEKFVTVDVVRWIIRDDRIKVYTATGETYDALYKDVTIINKEMTIVDNRN